MSATRNTNSALTDVNGNNRTATHLATNIIIKVGNNVVGAVQTLTITEARNIKMIDEVGTDGHIDSAPTASTDISGNCTRVRFDKQRIADAFSRDYVHVSAQRIPFDIEIHDIFQDENVNNAIITTIKNVWIKEISYDYSATDWVISDQTTTNSGAPEEQELSVVFIRDSIAKTMRAAFAGYIGSAESPTLQGSLQARANGILASFIASGLISAFANLQVARDTVDPRQWNITVQILPVYPVNWIYIQIGVGVIS